MKRQLSIVLLLGIAVSSCGGTKGSSDPVPTAPAPSGHVEIVAQAGPVCPVETDPPSPECAPRPVPDAVMVVTNAAGSEVARGATAADGTLVLEVPAGELTIMPQAVDGLLGTAAPIVLTIAADQTINVTADYDTGIR